MATPIAELRSATEELHQNLDTLPYVKSVMDATVTKVAYGAFLRAAGVIQENFERLLLTSEERGLLELRDKISLRAELVARDLAFLGEDRSAVDAPALLAELFAQRLRWFAREEPFALAGVAYVLEGSTLGGRTQVVELKKRTEFSRGGLEYLTGTTREARASFQRFAAALNQALDRDERREQAVRGAVATFEAFTEILTQLEPGVVPAGHVTLLNSEAGQHSLPNDLREIAAALRAGEISWQRYGYYAARYGERGLRFTRSDSAWLAALARRDSNVAQREIAWLGRVLAHRGMPRYLLEEHLETLHRELSQAVPGKRASYDGLLLARDQLTAERRTRLEDASFFALAAELERNLPAELLPSLARSGVLLVAAVVDEACGINGAVASTESWFVDANRFPESWITAVRATIAETRRAIAASPSSDRATPRPQTPSPSPSPPDAG